VDNSTGGRTTYQNIAHARRRGVEARLDLPLTQNWHLEGAYTHIDATFRSAFLTCPPASTCTAPNTIVSAGAALPSLPKDFANAAVRYRADAGWSAGLEANGATKTPVNDLNTDSAPGYATVDAVATYAFMFHDAHISTFLRVNNLADRHYAGSVIVNESNG